MNRRQAIQVAALGTFAAAVARSSSMGLEAKKTSGLGHRPQRITTKDGVDLFVQDWGSGQPIVFLSAWAFNSNVWGSHMAAFTEHGYRCVAPDRRGHGRSDVPNHGYDADTLADDVAAVIEQKDLRDVVLVAHSMGSIEAVRYCARHGMDRIARLVLAAPTTPFLTQTADNPDAIPSGAIESQYAAIAGDYPKWIADNEEPFFMSDTVPETRNWIKSMMLSVPLPVALACRRAIAAADTRVDLQKIVKPVLILHGDKDASAPLPLTGAKTAKLIANSRLIVYPGAPHAIILTHRERLLADMLAFIE
ncbi:MAG TPA: alpha/beta hydrolase [Candidatus Angelobacter sp.]|nr:alpha/beta hydrolase [Candidatus Angelobacter sp.]